MKALTLIQVQPVETFLKVANLEKLDPDFRDIEK